MRRRHIDVAEASPLVYADHQHFAIVLFVLQRGRHNLVTLILTCVPHTHEKKKKKLQRRQRMQYVISQNNNYTCISPSRKICLENSAVTLTIIPQASSTNPSRTDAQRAKSPRGDLSTSSQRRANVTTPVWAPDCRGWNVA